GFVWRSGAEPRVANGRLEKTAVGLVVDPIFNARITVIPTTQEAITRFRARERGQILPQPQDWLGVSDAGSISVRVERTSAELRAGRRVRRPWRAPSPGRFRG